MNFFLGLCEVQSPYLCIEDISFFHEVPVKGARKRTVADSA